MNSKKKTRSFFLGSDLAGVDGVTYSVVYSAMMQMHSTTII